MFFLFVSVKRKGEDEDGDNLIKSKRLDGKKCTDLIVLNLPWRVDEAALKTYFSRFGDVVMAQVCVFPLCSRYNVH